MSQSTSSSGTLRRRLRRNFILQQGFGDPGPGSCRRRYSALQFQPRLVTLILLVGIVTGSVPLFAVLAILLWMGAALPRWNPFELLHRRTLGRRPGAVPIPPAPPPRRFAQALAGAFSAAIAILLYTGLDTAAAVVEGVFLAAVVALGFGGFCLGSFLYHLLRRRVSFALGTLPWSAGRGRADEGNGGPPWPAGKGEPGTGGEGARDRPTTGPRESIES